MLESSQDALPNVQKWSEALSDVREWWRGRLGCSGVVKRPSRLFGSGQEALPDVQKWSEALRMSRSGRETLPDVRE